MKIYYCLKCGWKTEMSKGEAIANKCGNCKKHGMRFVKGTKKEVEAFFKSI